MLIPVLVGVLLWFAFMEVEKPKKGGANASSQPNQQRENDLGAGEE